MPDKVQASEPPHRAGDEDEPGEEVGVQGQQQKPAQEKKKRVVSRIPGGDGAEGAKGAVRRWSCPLCDWTYEGTQFRGAKFEHLRRWHQDEKHIWKAWWGTRRKTDYFQKVPQGGYTPWRCPWCPLAIKVEPGEVSEGYVQQLKRWHWAQVHPERLLRELRARDTPGQRRAAEARKVQMKNRFMARAVLGNLGKDGAHDLRPWKLVRPGRKAKRVKNDSFFACANCRRVSRHSAIVKLECKYVPRAQNKMITMLREVVTKQKDREVKGALGREISFRQRAPLDLVYEFGGRASGGCATSMSMRPASGTQ